MVYLFTCSIDLKPSLRASFTSLAVESFWKSKNGFVLDIGLFEGNNHIFLFCFSFEHLIFKFSRSFLSKPRKILIFLTVLFITSSN